MLEIMKKCHVHKFVKSLGGYDLLCNGVKVAFIPALIAKNQMIKCPKCGGGANYHDADNQDSGLKSS